jgi:ABC-type transporter Mla MlaB component
VAFSLFGKKSRKDADPSSIGGPRTRGESIFNVKMPSNTGTNSGPNTNPEVVARQRKLQAEMNAKIDAIESEMAGEFSPPMPRDGMPRKATPVPKGVTLPSTVRHEPPPDRAQVDMHTRGGPPTLPPLEIGTDIAMGTSTEIDVVEQVGLPPIVEEAAIFFANGQQADCERALKDAISADATNRDAWLLLFELLQQTGQSREFEALAVDFSVKFESSPPAWRTPAALVRGPAAVRAPSANEPSIQLPTSLDAMAVREFDQVKRQLKQSHRARLSFEGVMAADEVGAQLALDLLRHTATTTQELTLVGVEPAVHAFRERLIAGQRDQPESVWLLTLELYRLLGWDRQYEDLSVDYSISFEVSPPQQDRRAPNIVAGQTPPKAVPVDDIHCVVVPSLRGDITGKADDAITSLTAGGQDCDEGQAVEVDCGSLGRVDFAAAGALLNWLVAAEARGRKYVFRDVNQLVAALFRVMGIDTVVEVQRRRG